MNYDYVAIPDSEVPAAVEPVFQRFADDLCQRSQ